MSILQHAASATPLDVSILVAAMNVSVHSSLCCSWKCLFYCRQSCPYMCSFSSYFSCFVFSPHYSVPFRASEWALPWTSEYPRNEQFLPRNNRIHSESIPRNFFGTNSVANLICNAQTIYKLRDWTSLVNMNETVRRRGWLCIKVWASGNY
jgi:hypothetical protein